MNERHTARILVVDDYSANLRFLTAILEDSGHTVYTASEGMAALRVAVSSLPDLILLDVMMPNIDGFRVCQFLKEHDVTKNIPVIFMTSLTDTQDKVRGFNAGAADYITKPFQVEEVLARIGTLLSLHDMRKNLEDKNSELLRVNAELADVNKALNEEIAGHRQATEALKLTLARLQELVAIINRSSVIAFLWDAKEDWKVHYVSDNIMQLGYAPEDLILGRVLFSDLIHPDDRDRMTTGVFRNLLVGEDEFTHQYRLLARSGEVIWVDGRMWALRAGNGDVTYYQGILMDITERKEMEMALQESEERLRTLINAMPDIVAFKDGEGRWLEANDFDLRLFQLEKVDYMGKKDSELAEFSPFYRDAFMGCEESDEIAWRAGTASRKDEVIPRPEGPPMIFDIIKVPTFHPDGRRKGLVVVGRDVTERKRAEAELEHYREQLEDLVVERTEELADANQHLMAEIAERKRAEEQVRASLKEKEILLKEVHHRVKNNLQIISTLLDLQSYSFVDNVPRNFLRDCQDRIRSMALVHEQLYKSRDLSSIEFDAYLRNLAESLSGSFIGSPERITMKVETDAFSLGIDEAIPCGLIVNELISNSMKHAFPDNREGEISIVCRAGSDGMVTLDVGDNGVGLPPDLDFRTTETLGLQIVKMLTRQLRGEIEVDCNQGTQIRMRFCQGVKKKSSLGNAGAAAAEHRDG